MSIRFLQSGDEAGFLAVGGQISSDDDGWWAGAQRCFASVALATALAATTFAAQLASDVQQDPEELPAASLAKFTSPDEDFWRNSVAPAPPTIVGAVREPPLLSDVEEIPAGSLQKFVSPDEDFWDNPVNPAPITIYQELPYLEDAEEIPAGALFGVTEETEWQNRVAPVAPTFFQILPYLPELSDEPAGSLHGQPDEDFWANPVAPVPPTIVGAVRPSADGPLLPDIEEVPAGSLCGQPDEDFWANPVAPVPPTLYQQLPCLPDVSDDPAGSLLNFVSPDEDFWQNPVAPVPPCGPGASGGWPPNFYQLLPYASGETADVLPQAAFPPDEDFWPPLAIATGGWQNPVAAGSTGIFQPLPYLPEASDDPAGSLYSVLEETEWRNWVAPVPPTPFYRLPYLPEASDDPAGSLYGVPEETEWSSRPAPTQASTWQALPYAWGETLDVLPPIGFVPDEDFWANPVAPVPSTIVGAVRPSADGPLLSDIEEVPAGSLYGVPEETEWQNPQITQITQIAARIFQPLPYASGEVAEILSTIVSDDDVWPPLAVAVGGWQNPIIPGHPSADGWMQQAVYGSDVFSSFWWTSTWGVRTYSPARARASHSEARKRISRSTARARTSRGVSRQSSVVSGQK